MITSKALGGVSTRWGVRGVGGRGTLRGRKAVVSRETVHRGGVANGSLRERRELEMVPRIVSTLLG